HRPRAPGADYQRAEEAGQRSPVMSAADRHAGDRLAALADGRLPASERDQVVAHLGRCARCRSDYDAQLTMKGMLGGLRSQAGPSAPPDLRARLSDLARPVPPPSPPGRPPRGSTGPARSGRSARRRSARAGAGLVAITALVLAGGYALGGAPDGAVV